jgi:hypothetical protein
MPCPLFASIFGPFQPSTYLVDDVHIPMSPGYLVICGTPNNGVLHDIWDTWNHLKVTTKLHEKCFTTWRNWLKARSGGEHLRLNFNLYPFFTEVIFCVLEIQVITFDDSTDLKTLKNYKVWAFLAGALFIPKGIYHWNGLLIFVILQPIPSIKINYAGVM